MSINEIIEKKVTGLSFNHILNIDHYLFPHHLFPKFIRYILAFFPHFFITIHQLIQHW